ncbi:MAG: hypothetical protein WEA82_04800 [Idiomarina sp.]
MPSLDAILPYIPRDTRVGLVREHERVNQVEKNNRLRELVEDEQNTVNDEQKREQQRQFQQRQQQPSKSDDDSDDDEQPHLDTYA